MKYLQIVFVIIFVSIFSILENSYGQSSNSNSKRFVDNWFINGSIGTSQFYGDMSNENPFQKLKTDTKIGTSLSLGKMVFPFIGVRGQLYYGKLKSTSKSRQEYYESKNVVEANISLLVNLVDLIWGYKQDRFFTIYGTIGAGIVNWQSRRYDMNGNKLIDKNGYSGKGLFEMTSEFVIPTGVGLNFRLNQRWDVTAENNWHIVNSDLLDTRKNGFKYDIFMYTSMGFSYKFNLAKKEAEIVPEEKKIPPPPPMEIIEDAENVTKEDIIEQEPIVVKETPEVNPEEGNALIIEQTNIVDTISNGRIFRVQILSVGEANKIEPSVLQDKYNITKDIFIIQEDRMYKYQTADFNSYQQANIVCQEMIAKGIKDAFITIYVNGQRLK